MSRAGPAGRLRARASGQNYGQAVAIELSGPGLGLPPAMSGHNGYFLWGPGDWTGEVLIVIDDERERAERSVAERGWFHVCVDCVEELRTVPHGGLGGGPLACGR